MSSKDPYAMVRDFHEKFELFVNRDNRELQSARVRHMQEELDEYKTAIKESNREQQLDALVDLVYVALGTAHYEDFDFNEAFKRVHEANMKKVRKPSKRSQWDVVKPEGWVAPDIKDCI